LAVTTATQSSDPVGGPARATIFDASGKVIFSIPSR
jgi:hypothetical protein